MLIGPTFDFKGECHFSDNLNNDVVLTRKVWDDHMVANPDRRWYVYNWDAIKDALINPDERRRSVKDSNAVLWYGKVDRIWLNEAISIPRTGYWCVVVRNSKTVMTIYFAERIKEGNRI